jgi:hypothetical protein
MEEAHALVQTARSAADSVTEMLFGSRLYLAEHVAFAAAYGGFKSLSEKEADAPYTRRNVIRLLDLANGLLPDLANVANGLRDRMCVLPPTLI